MKKVQIGRIIEIYKDSLLFESEDVALRIRLPKKLDIAVGDCIEVDASSQEAAILKIQPRKSSLQKPINRRKKVVVSNIDVLAIMASSKPKISKTLVDKWLALSHINKLKPLVIFNKCDREDFDEIKSDISLYRNLDIECFEVSAKYNRGIQELKQALANQSIALVGLSGVGKSSLIKLLTGEDIKTQNLSKNTGRHTTTTTKIYTGEGFELIDTPGAGDIDLGCFDREQITSGFSEISTASLLCEFRNCNHSRSDKGCNVIKLVGKGLIAESRYKNYMQQIDGK
jgi:ribosome biogenesis GTPase